MRSPHHNRNRLGSLLPAAIAALAILALPGVVAAKDSNHDHNGDAGTIASFDATTGKLTIDLLNGETVSGIVTERTRIRCGHERHHHHRHGEDSSRSHLRPGSGEDGDNSGPGSGPPGQGDNGNDDPPGHDGTPPGASEDPGRGHDHSADCTTAALVAGATVAEAELELEHGAATFEEVELDR